MAVPDLVNPAVQDLADDDSSSVEAPPPPNADVAAQSTPANIDIPTEKELEDRFPNRPRNRHETLPFHVLYTTLFEPLLDNKKKKTVIGLRGARDLKPHEIRRSIIDQFISRWRSEVGDDIFPAFRLILCDKDRDRNVYHLKEQRIGKLLVKAMKINKDSDDGHALIHWRQPGSWAKSAGDFSLRCYEIIKKRPMRTTPGNLTISQVNEMLDRLSQTTGDEQQLPIITDFYTNMNAEEMMWLIRIILKQMKVGATEKTFFDAWHPDADALFNVSSSLRRVCWELWNPDFRLEDETKGVTLMSCFQPQLAQFQKKSLADAIKAIRGGEFWIEEKLDGERMQMHFDEGEFRWWSRKAKEYTHLYGSSWDNGSLSRFTKDAFDKRVRSMILDGEMITWDPKLDCIVGFGTLKTAAIETSNNPYGDQHRPIFRVFDILYLNGQSLLEYTLVDRRRALESVLTSIHRRIEIHDFTRATTVEEIETSLRRVIASASEGLVVKNPKSIYRLNDRNDDWVKVKPEYMTEYGESLDCLVIGGYWGSGRRGSILSSYLCGLRISTSPPSFASFFRVGGGFTANDYSTIAHKTDGLWKPWPPPKGLIELAGGDREYERPDVWIHPTDSFVVEVKAASVAPTDQFKMGCTLRFPRFKKMRPDKDWTTALSIQAFHTLQFEASEEAAHKKLDIEQRRGAHKRIRKTFHLADADTPIPAGPPPAAAGSPVFAGKTFCILSAPPKTSKAALEALVKTHGGRFLQTETAPSTIIIGDRNTVRIAAIRARGTRDVIRPAWLTDCIAAACILPLEPKHVFAGTPATDAAAAANIDTWGDSFARDVDIDELRGLLARMQVEHDAQTAAEMAEMLSGDELPGWVFAGCRMALETTRMGVGRMVVFAGGEVAPQVGDDSGLTHVVVDAETPPERVREIREMVAAWAGKRVPRVVTAEWVEECIRERTRVDEERFVA